MGLTARVAWRDLRRRTTESVLLLAALTIAASTLTIGLVLHGQTGAPYRLTRSVTAGPDVIGAVFPAPGRAVPASRVATLDALSREPGVRATSRPLPEVWAGLDVGHVRAVAAVQGRSTRPSAVDRPHVVGGSWVRPGGVVVERAFADALDVGVGDRVRLGATTMTVVGIAVSAALPPYPQICNVGCILSEPGWAEAKPGLVWATRPAVLALATRREPLVWFDYLQLSDPAAAPAFASSHGVTSPLGPTLYPWQEIARRHAELLGNERAIVLFGGSLLIVLAMATVVALVGGRMADEVQRVGTLKALGATPAYVARVLLTTYAAVAVVASCLGLVLGRIVAPHLVRPTTGLLGARGSTSISAADTGVVVGSMLAVVLLAVSVPAWRAARTSTVSALADAGRRPRRNALLVRLSASLPASALLGIRLASRRPRRAFLTASNMAVATCGAVAVLCAQQSLSAESGPSAGPADPNAAMLHEVLLILCLVLGAVVMVTLAFVARTTSVEARSVLAMSRALGSSPAQTMLSVGLAQVVPAALGTVAGIPVGMLLVQALGSDHVSMPGAAALGLLVVAMLLTCLALTMVAARSDARRPVSELLAEG